MVSLYIFKIQQRIWKYMVGGIPLIKLLITKTEFANSRLYSLQLLKKKKGIGKLTLVNCIFTSLTFRWAMSPDLCRRKACVVLWLRVQTVEPNGLVIISVVRLSNYKLTCVNENSLCLSFFPCNSEELKEI